MPQKRKSTQLTHHPNSNPTLSKQPTQTDKKKFSGSSLVKESKAAHKKKAVQFQRTEFNRSTQPTFHQEPNPNCSMYSDHNLQEASSSFPYYPNLNPNRSIYSDHHPQEASSSFPYDPTLHPWSLGYGHYNNGQWGPSNVFYQPPGQYLYNYEQPGYYPYNCEQPVPKYWLG